MKKLSLLVVLVLCWAVNQSYAQFEGKVQFDSYNYESGQQKKDDDSFVVYFTPDRIFLQGDKSYKVGGSLKADGILVRMKEQDFIFMTDKKKAMKISKSGITSFMNMFGADAKDNMQHAGSNIDYKNTGETQKINGYTCNKFIITDKEKPDERSEVWMTKALDINWGMLAEPWGDTLKGFTDGDLPRKLIFNEGYFPIQWKQYKNDSITTMTEANVTKTDVARSMVEIPSDVQVISLQDYLFQQMRNQH